MQMREIYNALVKSSILQNVSEHYKTTNKITFPNIHNISNKETNAKNILDDEFCVLIKYLVRNEIINMMYWNRVTISKLNENNASFGKSSLAGIVLEGNIKQYLSLDYCMA